MKAYYFQEMHTGDTNSLKCKCNSISLESLLARREEGAANGYN